MKNYFYSNELAEKIRSLLNENLPDTASKNITIGDLSILPGPDDISDYLPAVIISADEIENRFANESMNIAYTPYYFTIHYIYPYTLEGDNTSANTVKHGKQYAQEIANILMHYRTLDNFTIPKSETEAGGLVIHSMLSSIKFQNAEQEFFRMIEIPVHIANMAFCVGFRSFAQNR